MLHPLLNKDLQDCQIQVKNKEMIPMKAAFSLSLSKYLAMETVAGSLISANLQRKEERKKYLAVGGIKLDCL